MRERHAPRYRLIREPVDAEWNAAEYLRSIDVADVQITPPTHDGGSDVVGRGIRAEVKAHAAPVRVDLVRALRGVLEPGELGAFFSLGGYTKGAKDFADDYQICLWRFDLSGYPEPVNTLASEFVRYQELHRQQAEDHHQVLRVRCPRCGTEHRLTSGHEVRCSCGARLRAPTMAAKPHRPSGRPSVRAPKARYVERQPDYEKLVGMPIIIGMIGALGSGFAGATSLAFFFLALIVIGPSALLVGFYASELIRWIRAR